MAISEESAPESEDSTSNQEPSSNSGLPPESQPPSDSEPPSDSDAENTNSDEQVVDLGSESIEDKTGEAIVGKINVSDRDIFSLGKMVLAVCALLFLLICMYRILTPDKVLYRSATTKLPFLGTNPYNAGVEEVWKYSTTYLSNIVTLILGFYFGSKQASKA